MGTVIITGANGSLAIPTAAHLSSHYTDHTLLLTVRNDSNQDPNTARLRTTLNRIPNAKYTIRKLNLASLANVRDFAVTIKTEISQSTLPPLVSIICNAYSWSISDGLQFSEDGYEKTLAVGHLAHFDLLLRLVGSFDLGSAGRIVFISSDAHWPGKASLEVFPPTLPQDLELLARPAPDKEDEIIGRGFQRYALSKLASLLCMYEMNRRLEATPSLKHLSALAIDPGYLTDSRTLDKGVPSTWRTFMRAFNFLNPVVKKLQPKMRRSHEGAVDVANVAVGEAYAGEKGHFEMGRRTESSPESNDEVKQRAVWDKSVEWCGVGQEDTVLQI
ncbi:uncharacterized protein EI97DRAFT_487053 [Westerdykella ornata]|uniref:NAD(P)-binding protein n=1 Tax=Westerdykella ornata TaxID=318751 RepID=A0A6A6J526_WESOR|nr:uncharacterized protein EI97DRAFT_487053 [Westerdykella ornata]KAF2271690.1 hypothetical protein EI97DRAFT_487053 [Westerdykella ornata]